MKTKIFSIMVLGAMVAMTSCSDDDDLIVNNEVSNMVETSIVAKPFTYTSTADGKVTITLKNEQGQPYDRKWHVDYKEEDGNIMAMGADNSNMTLTPACPSLKEVLEL